MTAKDLKNALLQEAVQGKLVPQIASEGNARDLLEEIRKARGESDVLFSDKSKSKTKLVSEASLPLATARKRSSATPSAGTPRNAPMEISEDEIPFDIPESWCWCRLSDIGEINRGRSQHRPRNDISLYENGTIPFIQTGDVAKANGIILEPKTYYNEKGLSQSKLWKKGTICLTIAANIGDVAVLNFDACFPDSVVGFNGYEKVSDNKYVMYTLMWYKDLLDKLSHSTAQKNINLEILSKIAFPLPPLAEQKRIVAAIEKFMPLIEEYGKKETVLNQLNVQIGTLTKKAILQEAVQGKLVPQIPAEGNAKDLLEQIKAQKATLIKEGKIKKEKPLPEITEDEIPFDIPENWCWCRLGELITVISGTSYGKDDVSKEGIRILRGGNIQDNKVLIFDDDVFIPESYKDVEKQVCDNDIILVGSTGSKTVIGKSAPIMQIYENTQIGAFLRIVRPIEKSIFQYMRIFFDSEYYRELIRNSVSGTNIFNIKAEYLNNLLFPLPPLSEQKRIVAAIEQLLPLCEKLGK